MDNIAGKKSALSWAVHLSVLVLVVLWLLPTAGLFISSFRTADQIAATGWWKALFASEQNLALRTGAPDSARQAGGLYVIEGNLLEGENPDARIATWGTTPRQLDEFKAGETGTTRDGASLTLKADGSYRMESPSPFEGKRGERLFAVAKLPPKFTLANYARVLFSGNATDSMAKAFFNTLTVTIPATIIPILIAAYAAYALAWMNFPGRALLIAVVVALLVVPLQLALIPLLKLHLAIGIGKGYLGVWLAHTGFGLPMAIYLLRNYMAGLPRDIIENARVDGASEFEIFRKIILPLSFPALASFAIFQFLWTWNDLLVAKVFLIDATGKTTVMTAQIVELMGTRGGNWEILATAAFVSIAVPLIVFFAMQKYLVRGLLAGSVK
ncbi:carbohydrate ABC transporter permease [Pseudooceanicola sp. CBS1P-1]|uniref:ABC transporter permease subunit n=1 Tax=Pseudooceanicola albus TaxID=2692189 RepID=A0A6L7G3I1_9RHOB|nr:MULTISPECIES: carbohydrate ABC transporter permease [Pseudooceanicola]MBT9385010.1 carbohydrate ABC transporter permease [Pseudooceanicola endophyticus]MXN17996.1 ABC transporter permease subunit [Pseudooceanicola albus]